MKQQITFDDVFPNNFDNFDPRTKIEMLKVINSALYSIKSLGLVSKNIIAEYIVKRYAEDYTIVTNSTKPNQHTISMRKRYEPLTIFDKYGHYISYSKFLSDIKKGKFETALTVYDKLRKDTSTIIPDNRKEEAKAPEDFQYEDAYDINENVSYSKEDATGSGLKYYIDKAKYGKGILEVRYKKNKHLTTDFKPQKISSNLKKAIDYEFHGGKNTDFSLNKEEQRVFNNLKRKFGKEVDDSEEKELMDKFDTIVGQINAGNDSHMLKQQLRSLLIYCMKTGAMSRNDVLSYFLEYSL